MAISINYSVSAREGTPKWEAANQREFALYRRKNEVRSEFLRDYTRILHCSAFRRLKHKTQVFFSPQNDHICTRIEHVLHVESISVTIACALGLNEELTKAIAISHDLGHPPFGHAGEVALSGCISKPFRHNEQSLRVVDVLESGGKGLNLSHEVRDGIVGHTGDVLPKTLEGQVVRRSDQIAYVNHDIDDAIRAGILSNDDIPKAISDVLGCTHRERINTLVCDTIIHSREAGSIVLSAEVEQALRDLRSFMFERVYRNPVAKGEESKAKEMIARMYEYYISNPQALPEDFQPQLSFDGMERTVCDYIAGMTDKYAVDKYTEIFIPATWQVRG